MACSCAWKCTCKWGHGRHSYWNTCTRIACGYIERWCSSGNQPVSTRTTLGACDEATHPESSADLNAAAEGFSPTWSGWPVQGKRFWRLGSAGRDGPEEWRPQHEASSAQRLVLNAKNEAILDRVPPWKVSSCRHVVDPLHVITCQDSCKPVSRLVPQHRSRFWIKRRTSINIQLLGYHWWKI